MTSPGEFAAIGAVLAELVPAEADIRAIEVRQGEGGRRLVTIETATPGRLIGRRGATADALRAALAGRLGDEHLRLNIRETPPG